MSVPSGLFNYLTISAGVLGALALVQ